MRRGLVTLFIAAAGLAACNPLDLVFPKDERLGDEAEEICVGRVRATLTYEAYQELEHARGRFVPSYICDIPKLDLEGVQALIASGADNTMGTRLIQQYNSTKAAVERFKLTKVDRKGALFVGREPALYKVSGRPQPASTILASGCKAQKTNTRLIEVTWVRVGSGGAVEANPADSPASEATGEVINLRDVTNKGGVR